MSEARYIAQVDELLKNLRGQLLGQDVQYESILPSALQPKNDATRCAYLADQMTFALARPLPLLQGEPLATAKAWIYETLLFLNAKCNDEDQTFASIIRIISLPEETRLIMFGDSASTFPHLWYDKSPPFSPQDLERALLNLASSKEGLEMNFSKTKKLLDLRVK